MKANLEARGHPTEIVPIRAWDWWPTLAGGSFTFYMRKLKRVVRPGSTPVYLVPSCRDGNPEESPWQLHGVS